MTSRSADAMRPLWFCPRCGKPFANTNSSHSCVRIPLESHFVARPNARRTFDALVAATNEAGEEPVRVIVSKTRIELMTRARFAAVSVRRDYLRGHLWLKHRLDDPRFTSELLGAHDWVNVFELRDPADIDDVFRAALREARIVGDQRHPLQARYRIDPERARVVRSRRPEA
ncbi:MAG TPA: DUF5655 domain-containing protein [Candidatus Acidoferrum sp.]|nr:DUF5655 domain-containing protein [Candidatus Acidoferrum sp.]